MKVGKRQWLLQYVLFFREAKKMSLAPWHLFLPSRGLLLATVHSSSHVKYLYFTSLLKENLYIDWCGRVPKQWNGRKRIIAKIKIYLAVDAISFHQQYSFENASNVPMQLLLVSKRTYDRFSLEPTMRDITERLCCSCLQHLKAHRK